MNSERQSLITIDLFSSVILVAANLRSTVDAVPVPDSKSRTVKQYIKLCDWFYSTVLYQFTLVVSVCCCVTIEVVVEVTVGVVSFGICIGLDYKDI